MAKIGTFSKSDTGYTGRLRTLTVHQKVALISVAKTSQTAPDFRVTARGAEIGAGWTQIGQDSGAEYINLKLDDPSFAAPIRANLVSNPTGGFDLFWNR